MTETARKSICAVPADYWWVVVCIQRLNSIHLELYRKSTKRFHAEGVQVLHECAVQDAMSKTTQECLEEIIARSHEMWDKFVKADGEPEMASKWDYRAAELQRALGPQAVVRMKKTGE